MRDPKRWLGYFDSGNMGAYLVVTSGDGKIVDNAWSLAAKLRRTDRPDIANSMSASWFGYPAFLLSREKYAFAQAWKTKPPALRNPDGTPITTEQSFFDTTCTKNIRGQVKDEYVVTVAGTGTDSRIPAQVQTMFRDLGVPLLSGSKDTVGKRGWGTVHLCRVDFASSDYLALLQSQIAAVYRKPLNLENGQPGIVLGELLDGIHVDDVGRLPFLNMKELGFGDWALFRFKQEILTHERASSQFALACSGVRDSRFDLRQASVGEIRSCFLSLYEKNREKTAFWRGFEPFKILLGVHLRVTQEYSAGIYSALKQTLPAAKYPVVTGNFIPFFPGALLSHDVVDVPLFEWKYDGAYGTLKRGADYPAGFAFLGRLAAQAGHVDYAIISLYVAKANSMASISGTNVPMLDLSHNMLFFNLLTNGLILDMGHQFRDGYSPGSPSSWGMATEFLKKNREWFSNRERMADYALVFSPESQVASVGIDHFDSGLHNDEYFAWANLLTSGWKQWDALLPKDFSNTTLSRYKAVILPGVIALSATQRAVLAAYSRSGGTIIASGQNGVFFGQEQDFQQSPKTFDSELSVLPKNVILCGGYLHVNTCDAAVLLHQLKIQEIMSSYEPSLTVSRLKGGRTFIQISHNETNHSIYYIDINRFQPLPELGTDFLANDQDLKVILNLPGNDQRCLGVETIDDTPVGTTQSQDWGSLKMMPVGGYELTVRAGAVRFLRSIKIDTGGCKTP